MADDVDAAQFQTEKYLGSAIYGIQRSLMPDPRAPEATECEDCGGEIPLKRRIAVPATRRCVDCAENSERQGRRR